MNSWNENIQAGTSCIYNLCETLKPDLMSELSVRRYDRKQSTLYDTFWGLLVFIYKLPDAQNLGNVHTALVHIA
jgi:hypothetical protein